MSMLAKDLMTKHIHAFDPMGYVKDAYALMRKHGFHHLPLVNPAGEIEGIVSDRDILQHCSVDDESLRIPRIPIQDIMTSVLITCRPEDTAATVAKLFIENHIHCLPVIENGKLAGIITGYDLIKAFHKKTVGA